MRAFPPLAFSSSALDRGAEVRRDPAALEALAARADAAALVMRAGRVLIAAGSLTPDRIPLCDALTLPGAGTEPVFLGFEAGAPLYAVDIPPGVEDAEDTRIFMDGREAAMRMSLQDAAIVGQARALLLWRARNRFCPNCAGETRQVEGGQKRDCPSCGAEHYPRVDPVAIMLAVDGDRCLLGRQAAWPPRMWSALAGFVEPGETIEEGCARELKEEAGVVAPPETIRYVASQPWPFVSSIMIGLIAPVSDARLTIDDHELEAARWFTREEARAMLAGAHPDADVPPRIAIARRLIEVWANE